MVQFNEDTFPNFYRRRYEKDSILRFFSCPEKDRKCANVEQIGQISWMIAVFSPRHVLQDFRQLMCLGTTARRILLVTVEFSMLACFSSQQS